MKKRSLTSAEVAVLGLIAEKPSHGYDLDRLIEHRGLRQWTEIGFSSIYYLLNQLEKRGLVAASKAERGKKERLIFSITALGFEMLQQEIARLVVTTIPQQSPLLVALVHGGAVKPTVMIELLKQRAAALKSEITRLTQTWQKQKPMPSHLEALYDHSLLMLNAEIVWIARTQERLAHK